MMVNWSSHLVMAAVSIVLFADIRVPAGDGQLMAESAKAPTTAPARRDLSFELADGTLVTGRLDAAVVQFRMGPSNRLSVPTAKLTGLTVGLNDRPELTGKIDKLIEALDSETARDKAAGELIALGPSVEAAVRKYAAAGSPARRAAIAGILKAYTTWSADHPNAPAGTLEPFGLQSKLSISAETLVGSIVTRQFTIDSPYGRHTVALGAIRRIRVANVLTWPADAPPAESRDIIVDMADETRLRGTTKLKTLTVRTVHGKFAIPLKRIMEVQFTGRTKPRASVRCDNLDEILGKVVPGTMFPLKTPHGTVDLPLDKVASITISGGPLEAGLAFYWPFDKKNAVDKIAGVKGNVTASVAFAEGIVGLAPVFKNHTTKILLPSPRLNCNGWKQITFSAWLKFNSYSTYGNVYGRKDGKKSCGVWLATGGRYGGKWIGGSFGVVFPNAKSEMVRPASLKPGLRPYPKRGVWYHIVGTYDGRHVRVYFNGKLDGETKVATPGLAVFDSPKGITVIGRTSAGYRASWRDTYFPGPVDEIKIWKRALSAAEVKLLYAQTLARSKAGTPAAK